MEYRLALLTDLPAIEELIDLAIDVLQSPYLTEKQIASSRAIMGPDPLLIEDGTYYVALNKQRNLTGCGGWSSRATLYGGKQTPGRDPSRLDPETDAAKIRAMYTHPDYTRLGIGRRILDLSEEAASERGFSRCELVSTLAGEALYRSCGYQTAERFEDSRGGEPVPLIRMFKEL